MGLSSGISAVRDGIKAGGTWSTRSTPPLSLLLNTSSPFVLYFPSRNTFSHRHVRPSYFFRLSGHQSQRYGRRVLQRDIYTTCISRPITSRKVERRDKIQQCNSERHQQSELRLRVLLHLAEVLLACAFLPRSIPGHFQSIRVDFGYPDNRCSF